VPTATVRIRKGDVVLQDAACGDGPVDAALKTIDRITGIHGTLTDFTLQAITGGKDAMGEVSVRVAFDTGVTLSAKSASTDIIEAGARAYLSCVNRLMAMPKKTEEITENP
jgi:2-isopropylmalate synthase